MRLRLAAKGWRTIVGLDDAAAAEAIRADGIDILVDLDGHFPHNRLGVFAQRAAPVQVSAWGYVAGPGTPGIDALLTDRVVAPDAETPLFPERLIRLPCAQPYTADLMPRAAGIAPLANREEGPIRFGCFNRLDKLTDDSLALWGEILGRRPEATLTFKDRFLAAPAHQARVRTALARAGAAPDQACFEAAEPHPLYLAAFDRIDVALDPCPLSGGVTTLDGLSQGVPAITLAGAAPTGRITASILAYAGLHEGVCATREAYVRSAVGLAADPDRLAAWRASALAAQVRFSDAAMRGYVADVESAYAELWDRRAVEIGKAG
jgi:predicted O-linked N-acetylglucosamine transferase (SPINDLY family)